LTRRGPGDRARGGGLDPALVLVGLSGSQLIAAGEAPGLAVLNEAFADRRYQPNGQLVSRETPAR
jgi:5-oxoprolinase (ATP-hydrolysing) subunit A